MDVYIAAIYLVLWNHFWHFSPIMIF